MKKTSPFRQIGFAFFLFLALITLIGNAASSLISNTVPEIMNEGWFTWVFNYGITYLICFPIFILLMRKVPDTYQEIPLPEARKISIPKFLVITLCSYGIMQVLNIGGNLISTIIQLLLRIEVSNPLEQIISASSVWLNIIMVVIVAPVMEEYIFRGLLYKKLIGYGPKVYILFSSLLFMFFHINVYQMLYAFCLGLVFAGLTAYTGTIKYSLAMHMLINFVGSGISVMVLAYGGEVGLIVLSVIVLLVTLAGFITAVVLIATNIKKVRFGYDQILPIPNMKKVFLNSGIIVLTVFYILLLLLTHVAPILTNVDPGTVYQTHDVLYTKPSEEAVKSETFLIERSGTYFLDLSIQENMDTVIKLELLNQSGEVIWYTQAGGLTQQTELELIRGEYTFMVFCVESPDESIVKKEVKIQIDQRK